MEQNRKEQALRVLAALEKNGITGEWVETAAQARAAVEHRLNPGDVIGLGGSETLRQCGILELAYDPKYRLIDRYEAGLTPEARTERLRESLAADVLLCSSNAVTETGLLYNVDGTSNRVAGIAFGPRRVIMVVGCQKIVPDLAAAVERVRTVAAPRNAQRLHCATYCAEKGKCVACGREMGAGCTSPQRICRNFLVSGAQPVPGRIHVILVGEEVGY